MLQGRSSIVIVKECKRCYKKRQPLTIPKKQLGVFGRWDISRFIQIWVINKALRPVQKFAFLWHCLNLNRRRWCPKPISKLNPRKWHRNGQNFGYKFQPIPMYLCKSVEILGKFRKIQSHTHSAHSMNKVRILIYIRFWI